MVEKIDVDGVTSKVQNAIMGGIIKSIRQSKDEREIVEIIIMDVA